MEKSLRFKKTYLLIAGACFFAVVFIGNSFYNHLKPSYKIKQKIVFIHSNINYASGYQNHGYYIDGKGNMIKYDLSKEDKKYADINNLLEYLEKQDNPTINKTISASEMNKYYHHLCKINPDTKLIKHSKGADIGSSTIYGVTYSSNGKPNIITIYTSGDWEIENTDPYAKKIKDWLR